MTVKITSSRGKREREFASSSNSKIPVTIPTLKTHQSAARCTSSKVSSARALVASLVARIEAASRVAQRARKATKGRRGPGMLERTPIYLEPRWRRRRKRRVAANKRVGGESRMVGPSKIRASRRSQVEETPGDQRKKSISTLPAPRGGARCETVWRVPTYSLLKRRTRAQIIIRWHGNARPIARLDALWILVPFSHPLLTLPPLFLSKPLSNDSRRTPPLCFFLSLSPAERMALMKPYFFSFEDLRPGCTCHS